MVAVDKTELPLGDIRDRSSVEHPQTQVGEVLAKVLKSTTRLSKGERGAVIAQIDEQGKLIVTKGAENLLT